MEEKKKKKQFHECPHFLELSDMDIKRMVITKFKNTRWRLLSEKIRSGEPSGKEQMALCG